MEKLSPGWGGHKESFKGRDQSDKPPPAHRFRLDENRRLPGTRSDAGGKVLEAGLPPHPPVALLARTLA